MENKNFFYTIRSKTFNYDTKKMFPKKFWCREVEKLTNLLEKEVININAFVLKDWMLLPLPVSICYKIASEQ